MSRNGSVAMLFQKLWRGLPVFDEIADCVAARESAFLQALQPLSDCLQPDQVPRTFQPKDASVGRALDALYIFGSGIQRNHFTFSSIPVRVPIIWRHAVAWMVFFVREIIEQPVWIVGQTLRLKVLKHIAYLVNVFAMNSLFRTLLCTTPKTVECLARLWIRNDLEDPFHQHTHQVASALGNALDQFGSVSAVQFPYPEPLFEFFTFLGAAGDFLPFILLSRLEDMIRRCEEERPLHLNLLSTQLSMVFSFAMPGVLNSEGYPDGKLIRALLECGGVSIALAATRLFLAHTGGIPSNSADSESFTVAFRSCIGAIHDFARSSIRGVREVVARPRHSSTLPTLLEVGHWIATSGIPDRLTARVGYILRETLTVIQRKLCCYSVLRKVKPVVDKHRNVEFHHKNPIREAWQRLSHAVDNWTDVKEIFSIRRRCCATGCPNGAVTVLFCPCMLASYCSRSCQARDWHEGHREFCQRRPTRESTRGFIDASFFLHTLEYDVTLRKDVVFAHTRENFNGIPIIKLDYREGFPGAILEVDMNDVSRESLQWAVDMSRLSDEDPTILVVCSTDGGSFNWDGYDVLHNWEGGGDETVIYGLHV